MPSNSRMDPRPSSPITPVLVIAAAGLIAGTVPTIGISSTSRTMPRAMVLAVLQAMQIRISSRRPVLALLGSSGSQIRARTMPIISA